VRSPGRVAATGRPHWRQQLLLLADAEAAGLVDEAAAVAWEAPELDPGGELNWPNAPERSGVTRPSRAVQLAAEPPAITLFNGARPLSGVTDGGQITGGRPGPMVIPIR